MTERAVPSPSREAASAAEGQPEAKGPAVAPAPLPGAPRGTIRGRWGTRGRYRPAEAPPPVYDGQKKPTASEGDSAAGAAREAEAGTRTDANGIVKHLTGYAGVGTKTAETLVEAFGTDTMRVLDEEPDRVRELLTGSRAERVLEARREEQKADDQ